MPVTLADFRELVGDDVTRNVADYLRRSNYILNAIPFVSASAPAGGGAMAFTFASVQDYSTASTRALNNDYTADEATAQFESVVLKILGGSFEVDRALGEGVGPAVAYQVSMKSKAVATEWQRLFISGDATGTPTEFDGIATVIAGGAQEDSTAVDLTNVTTQADAFQVCQSLDTMLSNLDDVQGAVILANRASKVLLTNAARVAGFLTASEDAFGRPVTTYAGVPIIDCGVATDGTDIVPTAAGVTALYAARLGEDGVHALNPSGRSPVSTYLPDPNSSNGSAVLAGVVEMVTAIAVRHPRAVSALTNVTVAAAPAS